MEIVEVIGVDPSLRFTGIGKLSYNTETKKFSRPSACQVIQNKSTAKGTEAIWNMLYCIENIASEPAYCDATRVIVESPVMPFNAKFQGSSMISVAHISGGAASLFGLDRVILYRPGEWNRSKKKEFTHAKTQEVLGCWEEWEFSKQIKRSSMAEHVLDAISMCLFYINKTYIETPWKKEPLIL